MLGEVRGRELVQVQGADKTLHDLREHRDGRLEVLILEVGDEREVVARESVSEAHDGVVRLEPDAVVPGLGMAGTK